MVVYSEILNFIENSKTTTCIYHKMKHYLAGQYNALVADDAFLLTRHTMKSYATDLNKRSPKEYSITDFREQGVLWKMHLGYLRLYSEFFEKQ